MTIKDLLSEKEFTALCEADFSREITCIYCCDLLSVVMGKAPQNSAWITVMGNINAVAVAALADISVIVLADGSAIDEKMLEKAKEQDINVIKTTLPIYETAKIIGEKLK